MSTTTTTLPQACGAAPIDGCRTSGKAVLAIGERRVGKEHVLFAARRFDAGLPHEELGDPVGGETAYRLCVYDAAGRVVVRLAVDRAGHACGPKDEACWKALKAKGYAYRDATSSADGVTRLVAKAGPVGKGGVRLKARNVAKKGRASLPTGIAAALAGNDRATVQLVTSDAGCMSVVLDHVKTADGSTFKAKHP
jgi:hypothetical protein